MGLDLCIEDVEAQTVNNQEVDTKLTPMMQQWHACKAQAKDALLFFRLGDFYEAFYDDAKTISKELDLTLTQRQDIPMCGIPWHTSEGYIERLVLKGFKVAVAEQVEDPKKAKGLVSRKLVRIVSPATLVGETIGNEKGHTFFAALCGSKNNLGLALIDLVTASFWVFECQNPKDLINELFRHGPKELLLSPSISKQHPELITEIRQNHKILITVQQEWFFDPVESQDTLCQHFDIKTLDGFGLKNMHFGPAAAGALIKYLRDWQMCSVDHIKAIRPLVTSKTLSLDRQTLVNLELLEPLDKTNKYCSLVSILDKTVTPMGGRLLREWIKAPLVSCEKIEARQRAIEAFLALMHAYPEMMDLFDEKMAKIKDLEKLIFRIKNNTSGPREYVALKTSLQPLVSIKALVKKLDSELLKLLDARIEPCLELVEKLGQSLVDTPPFRASDGGLFKEGYDSALDELVTLRKTSREWLVNYQLRLRQETGIKTLKVGYNKMFGYYIEVSRVASEKMPDSFQRRQTLVNGERYISPELKEFEEKILTADMRIQEIEERLFTQLRKEVAIWHDVILQTAKSISVVDVLAGLAHVAKRRKYTCPKIDESRILLIKEGRHPVIEALNIDEPFISNDLFLDGHDRSLMCLTGPNMAGKSTYIRQTALLVIMAQIGSYIPVKEATIGIVDKVFSRIGASDDLARGQSTFMVEMTETASILHQATDRSLVILDEIGRGTSTYDGISIAWAVAEYLLTKEHGRPKTLFATHYFELTELATKLKGAINATVAISETDDTVIFLRKVVPGTTDRSYGIHVARLAGMPQAVLDRAEKLLSELECKEAVDTCQKEQVKAQLVQDDFFSRIASNRKGQMERKIIDEIVGVNIDRITPVDALMKLNEWKQRMM